MNTAGNKYEVRKIRANFMPINFMECYDYPKDPKLYSGIIQYQFITQGIDFSRTRNSLHFKDNQSLVSCKFLINS